MYVLFKERDDARRQLSDVKKDFDKQHNILQKCLGVNKKLLVEKVCYPMKMRINLNETKNVISLLFLSGIKNQDSLTLTQ
jgi:hypothetical protein